MLSEQIHRALAQGYNRFEVCRITARGVKVMHKPGARFEETIGMALTGLGDVAGEYEAAGETPEKVLNEESAPATALDSPTG